MEEPRVIQRGTLSVKLNMQGWLLLRLSVSKPVAECFEGCRDAHNYETKQHDGHEDDGECSLLPGVSVQIFRKLLVGFVHFPVPVSGELWVVHVPVFPGGTCWHDAPICDV